MTEERLQILNRLGAIQQQFEALEAEIQSAVTRCEADRLRRAYEHLDRQHQVLFARFRVMR